MVSVDSNSKNFLIEIPIIETAMGTTINAQQEESKQLKIVEAMHKYENNYSRSINNFLLALKNLLSTALSIRGCYQT